MSQTTQKQRFAERADMECRVNDLIKSLKAIYNEAGKNKMVAYTCCNRLEAEIQAARQRAISEALDAVRANLRPYLHKYNKERSTLWDPCGVCGRPTLRSDMIDGCCRGCKRMA